MATNQTRAFQPDALVDTASRVHVILSTSPRAGVDTLQDIIRNEAQLWSADDPRAIGVGGAALAFATLLGEEADEAGDFATYAEAYALAQFAGEYAQSAGESLACYMAEAMGGMVGATVQQAADIVRAWAVEVLEGWRD